MADGKSVFLNNHNGIILAENSPFNWISFNCLEQHIFSNINNDFSIKFLGGEPLINNIHFKLLKKITSSNLSNIINLINFMRIRG